MNTGSIAYTLAILLTSTNLRHFRLMLRSVRRQSLPPAEVIYLGLPLTGSAVAHHASRNPLPIEGEQTLVWCSVAEQNEPTINWSILESVAHSARSERLVLTTSDVVLHHEFAHALLERAAGASVATSFPVLLSTVLSNRLDERAIDDGEPFRSWWRLLLDGIVGQTSYALRSVPLGSVGDLVDRITPGNALSSTGIAMTRQALDRLLAAREFLPQSERSSLLASAGIDYHRATWRAKHVRLADARSQIFALAPVSETAWNPTPLGVLDIRPVLRRHQLN
jgi:hypothetical protein